MIKEPITNIGYTRLVSEITNLKETEIPEIIQNIKISASYGDLTENAEYEAALERQGFLLTRLSELQSLLNKLIIIDPLNNNHNKISFGSTFKALNMNTNEELIYTLVGGYESDPQRGLISYNSPLAKVFFNKEVDDEVVLTLNNISTYYEILDVYFDLNKIKSI